MLATAIPGMSCLEIGTEHRHRHRPLCGVLRRDQWQAGWVEGRKEDQNRQHELCSQTMLGSVTLSKLQTSERVFPMCQTRTRIAPASQGCGEVPLVEWGPIWKVFRVPSLKHHYCWTWHSHSIHSAWSSLDSGLCSVFKPFHPPLARPVPVMSLCWAYSHQDTLLCAPETRLQVWAPTFSCLSAITCLTILLYIMGRSHAPALLWAPCCPIPAGGLDILQVTLIWILPATAEHTGTSPMSSSSPETGQDLFRSVWPLTAQWLRERWHSSSPLDLFKLSSWLSSHTPNKQPSGGTRSSFLPPKEEGIGKEADAPPTPPLPSFPFFSIWGHIKIKIINK